jgi:large subunit ribosomal protein L28
MAKICAVCGKTPQTGNTRSHANNKSRRRFLPNLQSVRAVIDGNTRRVRVCASCIRAGKVTKAATT